MKKLFITGLLASIAPFLLAQKIDAIINAKEVERIENVLASDEMRGREIYSPGIDKAADFIASEFKAAGLKTWDNEPGYRLELNEKNEVKEQALVNVVGIVPGKARKDEYVVFSAHYDHLGVGKPVNDDSIFNGANDNASGTTAVILLAKYFATLKNNERTLVFVAFTAEEVGGLGSHYFSKKFAPDKVVAMFNIEMIGTESKWGKHSAYITGFEKTDIASILQKNLEGTGFSFYPDPYPSENLFYRSDNATLAKLGVPAHTISTAKMDAEPNYHKVSDEVKALDMENMAVIIESIALSSKTIVGGKDTPSRVKKEEPR